MPDTREDEKRRRTALRAALEPTGPQFTQAVLAFARKDLTATTLVGVEKWLRAGPQIRLRCMEDITAVTALSNPRYRQHVVRLRPDGSVGLPAHPELTDHVDGLLMLGALGGHVPTCAVVEYGLRTGQWPHWASTTSSTDRLLMVHTGMLWALEHVSLRDVAQLLSTHTTPELWEPWKADGWLPPQARQFLVHGVSADQARPWLTAGVFTAAAALIAAQGGAPEDYLAWKKAGVTGEEIIEWNELVSRHEVLTDVSPSQALWLRGLGFSPQSVRHAVGSALTLETAVRWAEAGIPGDQVLTWADTCGMDLQVALEWHRTELPVWEVRNLLDLVRASKIVLTAQDAAVWVHLGATSASDIRTAYRAGVSTQDMVDYGQAMKVNPWLPFGEKVQMAAGWAAVRNQERIRAAKD